MRCPACGNSLTPVSAGDVAVDVCRGGCGGIWFDHLELQKLDDQEESAGESLLSIERNPSVVVDRSATRACPRCGHPAMTQHFYSPKANVVVDECPRCEGIWLDAGELGAIRSQYPSGAARQAAVKDFIKELGTKERRQIEADLGAPLPGGPGRALPPPTPQAGAIVDRLFRFLGGFLG